MTRTTTAPPALEADLAAALEKLPEKQRAAVVAEFTAMALRLGPKPAKARRARRTPRPAAFGWLGALTVDDFPGEAA